MFGALALSVGRKQGARVSGGGCREVSERKQSDV